MSDPLRPNDPGRAHPPQRATGPADATTVRPPNSDPEIGPRAPGNGAGTRISHFEVRRVLGAGTFGAVYLAFDANLQREVAIKVPKAGSFSDEEKASFLKEARAAADIHHPNVCPVYEANTHEGAPYIVMRFVPSTLEKLLRGLPGAMPVRAALVAARKLALGLVAAHARGIVHRDLKPANVLYDEANREVLIADFGLARIVDHSAVASTGGGKGTPLYMPPEQWGASQWGPVGEHSDVYSLGVILYEMLTGRPPFTGTVLEVMLAHCQTPPLLPSAARPGLDPALDALCLKALAKRSADRYASARDFALALTNYLSTSGSSKPIPNVAGDRTGPGPALVDSGTSSGVEILSDETALATISVAEETRQSNKKRAEVPLLESPVFDPPLALPVPPHRQRRAPKARPVKRRTRPLMWSILFLFLVLLGFILTLLLDRQLSGAPASFRAPPRSVLT